MNENVKAVRDWAANYEVDRHSHEASAFRRFVKACDELLKSLEQVEAKKRKKAEHDRKKAEQEKDKVPDVPPVSEEKGASDDAEEVET